MGTHSAARFSLKETSAKHRLLDLASIVIRAFYPVTQPMGLGIGIGTAPLCWDPPYARGCDLS